MGQSIISIGTRHVKVWRTYVSSSKAGLERDDTGIGSTQSHIQRQSPTPKTFAGRNCLLGPLADARFTSVAAVSDCRAIICTAQGDICLLDDSHQTQRLEKVAQVNFSVLCVAFDHSDSLIWVAGRQGAMKSMHLDNLIKPTIPSVPPASLSSVASSSPELEPDLIALGFVRGRVVTIDSHRVIEVRALADSGKASVMDSDSKKLPAHESAVLGVSSLLPKARVDSPDFLTFSARGTVLFWLLDGTCTGSMKIPLDQPSCPEDGHANELKIVAPLGSHEHVLTGDKLGILR